MHSSGACNHNMALSSGVEEAVFFVVQNDRRQSIRPDRPGIDRNPVIVNLSRIHRRMPVDDDEFVLSIRLKERFANPEKVFLALFIERHTRPNSGMHEKIIALDMGQDEGMKEVEMGARHFFRQLFAEFLGRAAQNVAQAVTH